MPKEDNVLGLLYTVVYIEPVQKRRGRMCFALSSKDMLCSRDTDEAAFSCLFPGPGRLIDGMVY